MLIFHSDYGEGHRHAALALAQALGEMDGSLQVKVTDFMRDTHPFLHILMRRTFFSALRYFPAAYRLAYRKTKEAKRAPLLEHFTALGERRMATYVQTFDPDVIVSTHPFASQGMAYLKRLGYVDVPLFTIITDHTDHRYWLSEGMDMYLVSSDALKAKLIEQGIPETRVLATGIPIETRFAALPEKEVARSMLHLPQDTGVLLVMGGGMGMVDDAEALVEALISMDEAFTVVFVAGHNERLRKKLTAWRDHTLQDHKVRRLVITGFTQDIALFMAASDIIITKPGGLTTSEAIASQLPMILYKPLPGQEEDNALFLSELGVAWMAGSVAEVVRHVQKLWHRPDMIKKLQDKARLLDFGSAAYEAATIILQALDRPKLRRVLAQEDEAPDYGLDILDDFGDILPKHGTS
ncbi:MAG: hypothetical protein IMX04_05280 [Candidatus Carbobacillus altaicus]|nr:hypothetical protein [Candidatus Carbobacillus altaicus]